MNEIKGLFKHKETEVKMTDWKKGEFKNIYSCYYDNNIIIYIINENALTIMK